MGKINKGKMGIIIIAVIVMIVVGTVAVVLSNSPQRRLQKHVSLGERYLNELKYEQAIASFQAALGIDEKCEDAYLGLATAYKEMGDIPKAIAVLEDGLKLVDSEKMRKMLEELKALYEDEAPSETVNIETTNGLNNENVEEESIVDICMNTEIKESDFAIDALGQDWKYWDQGKLNQYLENNGDYRKVYYAGTDYYFWESDELVIMIYPEDEDPYHTIALIDRYTTFLYYRDGGIGVFNYEEHDRAERPILKRPDIMDTKIDDFFAGYSEVLSGEMISKIMNIGEDEKEIYQFKNCQMYLEKDSIYFVSEQRIIALSVDENGEFSGIWIFENDTNKYREEYEKLQAQ